NSNVRLIILATSNHPTHMQVIKEIRKSYKKVMIAGLSRYNDEIEELKQAGVQCVFNLYAEAGVGYAEQTFQFFNEKHKQNINPDSSGN
ncbi:MAG: hypothetical protein KAI29_29710, partial [Cyclobacteriaceae bacterium]|nr:hypothetical protein [Cyclobacteriaceae bacterium]